MTFTRFTIYLLAILFFGCNNTEKSVKINPLKEKTVKIDPLKEKTVKIDPLKEVLNGLSSVHVENMPKVEKPLSELIAYTKSGRKLSDQERQTMLNKEYEYRIYMNENKVTTTIIFNEPKLKVGDLIPDFSLTDINGKTYTLESLKGKVVVINFWFIACSPCVAEMPSLNKLVEAYKDNQNVVFLAVTWDNINSTKNFLKKNDFKYNIVPNKKDFYKVFDIKSFPKQVIIDQNSKLDFNSSTVDRTVISKRIEKLLSNK